MARRTKRLFTIGYEQTPAKAVLDELENAGVKLLVDVRAVASSRRPGFSKNQLAAGLDERGISYLHLKGLGTPKSGREAARSGKFGTSCFPRDNRPSNGSFPQLWNTPPAAATRMWQLAGQYNSLAPAT